MSLQPQPTQPRSLEVRQKPPDDWEVLGDTFEAMGKIGLALTVGFTAAAVFCRWADQRKLKVPAVAEMVDSMASPRTV
jgi:hypothetical protein